MLQRNITPVLLNAMADTPVVFLQGARQTGKSTLAQNLTSTGVSAHYYTLDDAATLAAAAADPQGFVAALPRPAVIDEVQLAPELAPAIKKAVDEKRRPGQFLLTGSANALVLPRLANALVGRLEMHTLWPLSQGELAGRRDNMIDTLFSGKTAVAAPVEPWPSIVARMATGGYPEMLGRKTADRRQAWLGAYVGTILQRDVRAMADVRDLSDLPRLLALIASRTASLLDYADIARALPMPQTTLKRYMALLEATFLLQPLRPWFTNRGKRLVKSPKMLVADSGLLCYLLGVDEKRLLEDRALAGAVLENFVVMEFFKQRGWAQLQVDLYHFRTYNGQEVDLVLEDRAGRVAGVEVKASATLASADFDGLRALAALTGQKFCGGLLLYSGDKTLAFGEKLTAAPISALWQTPAATRGK